MKKTIAKTLTAALLDCGVMQHALYEHEIAEIVEALKASLLEDQDEFIFAVTENNGDVAMVLIERSDRVYINEAARDKLQMLWPAAYAANLCRLIPLFADQLHQGEIAVTGVKIADVLQA